MKYLLFIIFILNASVKLSQAQSRVRLMLQAKHDTVKKYQDAHAPVIAAKEAYKYVGRMVIVKDNLYRGTTINDTTQACEMGEKTNTPRLTVLYTGVINKHADGHFFYTYRYSRITIWGIIRGTKEAPIIILHGLNSNFAFDAHVHGNP